MSTSVVSSAAITPLIRWWRFNLVGVIGFGVQMAALAILRRLCGPHYLLASAIALELTLLHNFCWHLRYTWRDRHATSTLHRLARFHLSNGAVSFAGNLLVVRLLVLDIHLSLLVANAIAVLVCAVANFYLGNIWAFAPQRRKTGRSPALDAFSDFDDRVLTAESAD